MKPHLHQYDERSTKAERVVQRPRRAKAAESPGRGKSNPTVALLRAIERSDWKQPGRRYGPAPMGPGPRHQVAPMDTRRRCLTYAESSIRALPTDRQVRQIQRMAKRLGEDVEAIVEQLAREACE